MKWRPARFSIRGKVKPERWGPRDSADGGDKLFFQPDVHLARCRLGPARRLGRLVFRWTGLHRPWTWNSLSLRRLRRLGAKYKTPHIKLGGLFIPK